MQKKIIIISNFHEDTPISRSNMAFLYFKDKGYEIKIHQGSRSLAEQAEHLKTGASTIPVSLHNVGEAVDISFWKDGKKVMIDNPDKQTKETKETSQAQVDPAADAVEIANKIRTLAGQELFDWHPARRS